MSSMLILLIGLMVPSCMTWKKRRVKMGSGIRVLIPKEDVKHRIKELAIKINEDYKEKSLHLISILKGGVFFSCELAKHITVPITMDFMSVSSYGEGTVSCGRVKITKDLDESIKDRDVLMIEDILDSGNTLDFLIRMLKARNPASLKLCVLLDKPDRREKEVSVDYTGFCIPDEFVVGYGLDYKQRYRNLQYIGVIEDSES
jgi:hypoxanthine phosphoribosyltransferase